MSLHRGRMGLGIMAGVWILLPFRAIFCHSGVLGSMIAGLSTIIVVVCGGAICRRGVLLCLGMTL